MRRAYQSYLGDKSLAVNTDSENRIALRMNAKRIQKRDPLKALAGAGGGGIHFPKQDAAPPPTSPYAVAPNGRTTGWFAGGGVYLIPAIAVDVAWARTGVMSSVQTPRFNQTFALDLRDNFISLGARVRVPAAPHFTLEPVGGLVILLRENWSQQ
jgi:hypothetical protein